MTDGKGQAQPGPAASQGVPKAMFVLFVHVLAAAGRVVRRLTMDIVREGRSATTRLDQRRRRLMIGGLALLLVGSFAWSWWYVPYHWWEASQGRRPLLAAKSWFYNLDKINLDHIANQTADLLVIDYAKENGTVQLTPEEVARVKKRPDGTSRLVVSYLSVGEAESYRYYWNSAWKSEAPGWHVAENCSWPKAHMVRFWHDGWKDIVYRGKTAYLKRIIEAGFDGVYLDRVDVYSNQEKERPSAREDMVDFVAELAAEARKLKPGFLVIGQNAEELLVDRRYRDTLDGLGKEDLLNGVGGTGKRNPEAEIAKNRKLLRLLQWDWKPVFAVEYLPTKELMAAARTELESYGLVPTFAHRNLDGLDPTLPREPAKEVHGSAEWIAANCKDKPYW